jgi:hypothetical protein
MTFDPAKKRPANSQPAASGIPDALLPDHVWYRIFTNMVFDGFVKGIVRDRFHVNPLHVTLHVTRHSTMLYVKGETGGSLLVEDDEELTAWAMDFIAAEMFSVNPDDVEIIYLDGAVGAQDAYLHIAGRGIYIASGEPKRRGRYL